MAVGLTPKHIEEYTLVDSSPKQFLAIAAQAIDNLKWCLDYASANGLIAFTNNGLFKTNAKIEIKIIDGKAVIKSSSLGNEMIDFGKNRKFVAAFLAAFNELKLTATAVQIDTKYGELQKTFVPEEEDILLLPPATTVQKLKSILNIFRPVYGYYITPILVNINILVFVLMLISGISIIFPDSESLLAWGANFRPVTLNGQWWRLLTNCFLHIGIIHLAFNMYALIYIGLLLEPYLGAKRFLTGYLLTGIIASMTSIAWHDLIISAGASGAIFGMYGVFLAMLTTNVIERSARKPLLTSISIFVVFNLINGLKSGIDNAAHIGGLISGIIIGYAFVPGLRNQDEERAANIESRTILMVSCLVLLSTYLGLQRIPNDLGQYDKAMKRFAVNEAKALNILTDTSSRSKVRVAYEVRYKSVPFWEDNIQLLSEADKLNIPYRFHHRNVQLIAYCRMRINVCNLIYKTINERTYKYQRAIIDGNQKIKALLKELKEHEAEKE